MIISKLAEINVFKNFLVTTRLFAHGVGRVVGSSGSQTGFAGLLPIWVIFHDAYIYIYTSLI